MIVWAFDPGATTGYALFRIADDGTGLATVQSAHSMRDPVDHAMVECDLATEFAIPPPFREVRLLCVEAVKRVTPRERLPAAMASAMATGLVRSERIAGELVGIAKARGIEWAECEASEWRAALVGKRTATDAEVKRAIDARLAEPMRTNAHVRDAIGVGLYCVRRRWLAMRGGGAA